MVDFAAALKKDLVEQFKGKANIEALMDVIGMELQHVHDFYAQLKEGRSVLTSVGKQLDGVGDIVALTRMEAGVLTGNPIPIEVIDDDSYRKYLIYKILKNTCNCTYPDIVKAFRMFWDRPLYYTEDPEQPATMIFDTGLIPASVDVSWLVSIPLLRAAGVGVILCIQIWCLKDYVLYIGGRVGTDAELGIHEKPDDPHYQDTLHAGGRVGAEGTLALREQPDKPDFRRALHAGGNFGTARKHSIPQNQNERAAATILRTGGVTTILSNISKGD